MVIFFMALAVWFSYKLHFEDWPNYKGFGSLLAYFHLLIFLWFNLTKGIVNIKIN